MNKMANLIIPVFLCVACQSNNGFVDKRFYNELIPYTYPPVPLKLEETRVIDGYGPNHWNLISYCRISENKIGYLEYKCNKLQECDGQDTCNSPIEEFPETLIFEITNKKAISSGNLLVKYSYCDGIKEPRNCSVIHYELGDAQK